MLSLLELPQELRFMVIDEVLDSVCPPPAGPADYPEHLNTRKGSFYGWSGMGNRVVQRVADATYVPRSTPLLGTCRQLRAETADRLEAQRRRDGGLRYDLDVMIAEESTLMPTWTRLPALAPRVDTVVANFRTCGYATGGHSAFRGGDGGPPPIIWCFYHLLCRFLARGPAGPDGPDGSQSTRPTVIGALELDFRTPTDLAPGTQVAPEYLEATHRLRINQGRARAAVLEAYAAHAPGDGSPPINAEMRYVMHPRTLRQFVSSYLQNLLEMSYHTAAFDTALYEGVGVVRAHIDGKLVEEWDLAEWLAQFPREGYAESFSRGRDGNFVAWREQAWRKRERAGLPVIYPDWAKQ